MVMVNWVKQRSRLQLLLAFCFCIMVGAGMSLIIGRTQAPEFWIIYGGNVDPGDGNGGGLARQQMIDGGWTTAENSFQVTWRADIGSGTVQATNDAMPAGKEALTTHCPNGRHCIIAGFSLGSMPALQLASETGHPAELTYIFGAPQPSTGVWHSQYQDNPFIEPWVETMGQLMPDRLAPAGVHNYYDTHDPYNNAAPQCSGPGLFTLSVNPGHRIVTRAEADASHQWTGPDGVLMFEVGYVGPGGLPLSGSDPSPFWAGCAFGDWLNTPNSPGPQTNPDQPGLPGLPSVPGLPGTPTP